MNFPSPRASTADHLRKCSFFPSRRRSCRRRVDFLLDRRESKRHVAAASAPQLYMPSNHAIKYIGGYGLAWLCKRKDALALHAVEPTATHGPLPPPFQILFALHWLFIFCGFALQPFFCQQQGTRRSFSSIFTHAVKSLTSSSSVYRPDVIIQNSVYLSWPQSNEAALKISLQSQRL